MSFTLELSPDCISKPTRLDQWVIEAAMLWPEDKRAREISVRASMTEWNIDHLPELTPELLHHVREHLKSWAPRIKELQPQINDRIWHGSIVGLLTLRSAVGVDFFGEKPLADQQAETAKALKPDFQIEPRTMNNRKGPLFKFRPVAHLWAAHGILSNRGRTAFPCTVSDIPHFLGTAEAIRLKAEQTRLPRSNWTVMRPGEAGMLSDEVKALLPRVKLLLTTSPEEGK